MTNYRYPPQGNPQQQQPRQVVHPQGQLRPIQQMTGGIIAPSTRPNTAAPSKSAAYYKGNQRQATTWETGERVLVEDDPNAEFALIRGPRACKGTSVVYDAMTRSGWLASVLWEEAVPRDTVVLCLNDPVEITEGTLGPSPFTVQPQVLAGIGTTGTVVGGAVGVARMVFGAIGVSKDVYFDVPPGQAQTMAFSAEAAELEPLIAPQYFFPNDTIPTRRTYDIVPGVEALSNTKWNYADSAMLQRFIAAVQAAGGAQSAILTNRAQAWAYLSDGHAYVDTRSRPSRRFSGSVAQDLTPLHTFSIAPRAWNCDFVELSGGQIDAAGNPITMVFFQEQVLNAQTRLIGPFPANQAIPILQRVTRIFVTTSTSVANGSADSLYELNYYVGF